MKKQACDHPAPRGQYMGTAIVRRIAAVKKILPGEHAGFITGTDLLIDGGTIAAIRTGQYKLGR